MTGNRRNHGCRLNKDLLYKGFKLLTMENELLKVSILEGKGTDIIEFLYKPKDIDFMWTSPVDFKHGEFDRKDFLEGYLGGWQEIIPNGGAGCIYKGASFNLHDETPQLSWEHDILVDTPEEISIKFFTRLRKMPLYVEKVLTLRSNEPFISIDEKISNTGNENLDLMWGHHPCFGEPFLSDSCIIDLRADKVVSNSVPISGNPLVRPDSTGKLKDFPGADGGSVDLSKVLSKDYGVTDLLYVTELVENWFSITNTSKEIGIGYVFSKPVFRFLYLWLAYGGSNGYPWYGSTYNLAIEPWSSWPGNGLIEAIKNKTHLEIAPGQNITSWLKTVVYERDQNVNKIKDDCEVL